MVRDLPIIRSVSDVYIEFETEDLGKIRGLCHQFGIIPDGVCKVTVIFYRGDLTRENCNDKLQDTGARDQLSCDDLW